MKRLSDRPEDYCFLDFETRTEDAAADSDGDLKQAGAYRYTKNSFPIILTYAIGNEPVKIIALDRGFDEPLEMPDDLSAFYHRATKRKAWFVAWNMTFDRQVWNHWMPGRPMAPEMTVDALSQAAAANVPQKLSTASVMLLGAEKQKLDGKKGIRLFSPADGAQPQEKPDEWEEFKAYAIRDTEAMRDIWKLTMKLPASEWEEYWASERINDRGVMVDVDFCREAHGLSRDYIEWSNRRLEVLTGRRIKVSNVKSIAEWVSETITHSEVGMLMEEDGADDVEDDGESGDPEFTRGVGGRKLRLDRSIIRRMLDVLAMKELDDLHQRIVEVLEIREFGGGTSTTKFKKMADQADHGRLKGQYVFNGGGQTGRFSSRGVQVHNLPRDSIGDMEEQAMLDVRLPVDDFAAKYGSPSKVLPRLIKPAFVAPKGKALVWCDWSNIEARVNPWLAQSRSGEKKLDVFRHSDAHPDEPDVYSHTAADLIGIDPRAVTKAQRQSSGKVPELSLGFGGGKGALLNMARNYGERVSEEQAQDMVERWRGANPWSRHFWDRLTVAIESAMDTHKVAFAAGRVQYMFVPGLLGGSLVCQLPGGRMLTYPGCKWEMLDFFSERDKQMVRRKTLTYVRTHNRHAALWYGKACENVVQGTAASLLRDCLVALREHEAWMPVVLHTHDDICIEVDEDRVDEAAQILTGTMLAQNEWNEGLPLAAEATTHWWLSKAAGRKI